MDRKYDGSVLNFVTESPAGSGTCTGIAGLPLFFAQGGMYEN